jgi:hypothetical protein
MMCVSTSTAFIVCLLPLLFSERDNNLQLPAPINSNVDHKYYLVLFNGSLEADSPYRGTPNPSIDKAWDRITKGENLLLAFGKRKVNDSRFQSWNDERHC